MRIFLNDDVHDVEAATLAAKALARQATSRAGVT